MVSYFLKISIMKRKILILSLLCFIAATGCKSTIGLGETITKDSTISSTEIIPHPRLLLLENEESQIHKNMESSDFWSNIHDMVVNTADRIIPQAVSERKYNGKTLSGVPQTAVRRLFCLAYAYRMERELKYLERAEKEMLAICAFSDWNPKLHLDYAEMTLAMAIGYDWLYNDLSESSRSTIREAIISKGLMPSMETSQNGFLRASHNHNQVGNAGMLYGAIAIYESSPEFAQSIIDRSIESIKLAMEEYAPNGAHPEGPMYWNYGTSANVMFLSALEKLYGTDYGLSNYEGFLESSSYFLHSIAPSSIRFNYSDAGADPKNFMSESMFWFANKRNDYSILWDEFRTAANAKGDKHLSSKYVPALIIWGSHVEKESIEGPSNTMWVGHGTTPVAFMQSDWSESAIYTGLKGGKASTNHGHMDAGSFIMESNGIRWALDLGMRDYHALESQGFDIWNMEQNSFRWKVFRYNNMSHNTLTVNDKLHTANAYASITGNVSTNSYKGAVADLTPVFATELQSSQRGVAIVNNKYVLIQDEIKTQATMGAKVRWAMATDAVPQIVADNIIVLTKNGATLKILVECDLDVQVAIWSADTGNDYDAPNPGVSMIGFEMDLAKQTETTCRVSLLPENVEALPDLYKPLIEWY
jgi:hypothetical protein